MQFVRTIQSRGIPDTPAASRICVECKSRVCAHVAKPLRRPLTRHEQTIIRHIAGGLSNKEIGVLLGITEGTVKAENTRLFVKLGVRSRYDVIRWAFLNSELIELPGDPLGPRVVPGRTA